MKKIISLLLSLVMVFSLVGCTTAEGDVSSHPVSDSTITGTYWTEDNSGNSDSDSSQLRQSSQRTEVSKPDDKQDLIDKDGHYFDKKSVALYIHTYGCLPENFITKDDARKLGWEGGNVEKYAPGHAIGGDIFGNYEGILPKAKGRTYYECDIDTDGYHSRGSRRIVFSDDGLIYYTHDHYESFELLYGEE